jgi:hypothetical protein
MFPSGLEPPRIPPLRRGGIFRHRAARQSLVNWKLNGERRARCARECQGAGSDERRQLTFDLYVAALSHAANEIVDYGPTIAAVVRIVAGRPIGFLDSVSAIETVDVQ